MKVTNKSNLPTPLFRAVSKQRPLSQDSISVTELISPPQIRYLRRKHWDELEEDAADRIWATMGTLMHVLLEKHGQLDGYLSEYFMEMEVNKFRVTGTLDLLDTFTHRLIDYKFVSVWTTMDGVKSEWEEQLNLYAVLARAQGHQVDSAEIVAIYRDWSKSKAGSDNYPENQVEVLPVSPWKPEDAEKFLHERLALHLTADEGIYPECSPAERWEKPTQYALHKAGQKRAVKLFATRDEALKYQNAFGLDKGHYIDKRLGSSPRCESYCAVSAHCVQRKRMLNDAGKHSTSN